MLRTSCLLILTLCLLLPTPAIGDPWSQFQEFNDGYYFLDDQAFESFTCTVTLPSVQAMVKDIQKQINSDGQKHLIRQNLSDFRMTFQLDGELTFIRPSLSVEVEEKEDTDEESRANMVAGVKMIENGFESTLNGVVMTLESLFSSYITPKKELYRLESFQREDEEVNIRYEMGGLMLDVSCQGNECSKTTSSDSADIEGRESYISVGGKHALQSYHGIVRQPEQTTQSTLSITYQEAGKLDIPHAIRGESTLTRASGSANGAFLIILEDCKVK